MDNVLVVTSAIPQAGKTTMALNLAAITTKRGRKTCILDLSCRGATKYFFPTTGPATSILCWLDVTEPEGELNELVLTGLGGIHIVPGPALPQQLQLIEPDLAEKVTRCLAKNFHLVIIDLDSQANFSNIISQCTTVIVTTPDEAALLKTKTRHKKGNLIVANKTQGKLLKRVTKILGFKPDCIIPERNDLIDQAYRQRPRTFPFLSMEKRFKSIIGYSKTSKSPDRIKPNRPNTTKTIYTHSSSQVISAARKAKRSLAVIDANYTDPTLALALGVPDDKVWMHDWRAGQTAIPYTIEKNFDVYTLDPEIKGFDDRDKELLKKLTANITEKYLTVIINLPKDKAIEEDLLVPEKSPEPVIKAETPKKHIVYEQEHGKEEHWQQKAIDVATDHLTGCLNRAALDNYLEDLTGTYSVLFCDLDNFKMVNDTYGHASGDEILRLFGEHLLMSTRRSDYVFRYGGDEFVVILSDTSIDGAYKISQKIASVWNQQKFSFIDHKKVLFSGGLAQNTHHGKTPKEVLKVADETLYRVKRSGRGKVGVAFKSQVRKRQINIPQDPRVMICTDAGEALFHYIKSTSNLSVIDADFDSNLAYKLNIPPTDLWKHDWRIGLSAVPALIGKKVIYYGMDKDVEKVLEQRDIRSLKDLINNQDSKQVVLYLGAKQNIGHHFNQGEFTIIK